MLTFRQRLSELATSASALAWVGFALSMGFCALAGLILAGETLTDPGGWTGLGLTALWLVPAICLAALAFYRPDTAIPVLAVATLLPIGYGVWTLVDYEGARGWEDETGPVSLVFLLMIAIPLTVEGLSRPTAAGLLMVGMILVPLALSMIGAGSEWGLELSIGVVTIPILVGGILYLLAGRSRAHSTGQIGRPRLLN